MARKKKQDNTSDNIQNIVNDASVSEKKTSQKRARSKVEDDSSNKKPEIAELEDRLGLSIDYNEEENVITLTPNRPQQSVSSLRQRPLIEDAEFVAEGDEVPDYVFGADNESDTIKKLELINRCELYIIGRAFTPTIVENLWEPSVDYGEMIDCSIETFNSDPWNLFIYSKAGRQAVTFGELSTGTFYLQCAAAEYVPNQDPTGDPIKQPMKDVYGRQMYRKVYFNGQIGQFPRINIGSYEIEDTSSRETTTVQYEKYQYVTNEIPFNPSEEENDHMIFGKHHMAWPQRKVTIYLEGLNFTVRASTLYEDDQVNKDIEINDNHSRNGQIIEITLPAQYSHNTPQTPTLKMPLRLEVEKTPVDLRNAYHYAHDANVADWQYDQKCWGGELHLRIEPEDCGPEDGDYSDTSLYICARRASTGGNNPSMGLFETIYASNLRLGYPPVNGFTIYGIDRNVNVYISSVRKNYTKKFIIMTDGNVIVSDKTELNDYLRLYTDEQIEQMNTPDSIVVGYQNTIGFLSTSPEWPWNKTIRVKAAIASEYQGIRFKAIGRYNDDSHMYDKYVKYRQGVMSDFTWDDQTVIIDGITCTPSHNGESEYTEEQPYIDYDISINKEALDETWERQIFYLAFEPIPKFISTTLKIFVGYNPANLQVETASGTPLNEHSDAFIVRNGDLWSFRYTTRQNDFGEDSRDPAQEGFLFKITNNNISTSNYSHVFISDNTTAIRDRIELPTNGETTTLAFTGRMYHNMSLFVRPLVAAKIKFLSNHNSEFGPNDQHFYIEYNSDTNVPLETDRQLTSEDDLKFSVKHDNDPNSVYTYISVDISYGPYSWNNREGTPPTGGGSTHIILNNNTLIFTIPGFKDLMDPTIEYCYVTLNLRQIHNFSVSIKHPDADTTDYWPNGSSALIHKGYLTVGGQNVSAESVETSTADGVTTTKYTFSTIYGDIGTGSIDINDCHCCGRAVKPDGSYVSLTTNQYARQEVSIPITVNAGGGGYVLDIQPFKEMRYQFMYQSEGGGGHVTVVPYTFDEYYNGWPANMDDISDMTVQTSWQPTSGNDMTSLVTPDLCMPLFGFRLLPTVDPETHNLDIFSKMTLGLQIVSDNGSLVAGPWPIASDYAFENKDSYFGVCPGSLTNANARAYFYPNHNGEPNVIYQFVVQMASQIAAEDLRITEVVYAKHTGGNPGHVTEGSKHQGINLIGVDNRLPGENPSNTSGNLEVYVHVPSPLDNNHKISLEFLDSSGSQLTAMYPMNIGATQVSADLYKFSVTTKTDELYGVESPNHTFYSGDNQYTMRVKYNDNQYHWLDVETCTYYMHPVFKLWFSDGTSSANSFSFDDSGNATIYFSVHIAGAPDASHPHGTTRTPNPDAYSGDPNMKLPAAGSTYNQTQWNASGCVLQITNAPGLSFKCDGVGHVIPGGYFYKLEVSGGVGFSGEVTLTMNVFNKTKTATLRNIVTFQNITWWNGSSMTSASNMTSAYLSPVTRFGTSGNPINALSMTAVIDSTAAASLDLDGAQLTCGLNCGGRITCSVIHPASGTNQLSLSVTVDFSSSEHPEYGAQKIDDWNLSKKNNEHPELSDYASMLYTGRPIPFTLSIDDFSYTFYVKLGPVIFIWVNNTTGGELKPHTGQEHVVRARAREWYSLDGGATVKDTGNYYGTGEDTSYTAREYYAKFEYYNGSTYSEIPNVTPSSSSIKSQRTGNGFNIVAPTMWIDYTQSPPHPYEDDWGAWRIAVTDESHANESGKMRATMQVFDHQTPEHSVQNWYPINATALEVNVRDFMTVSGIHFWMGRSNGAKYGAMKFEESVMPPIEPVGTSSAIDIYLAFADTSKLNIANATITTPYSATISIEKDTTGGQITTDIGSQTYTDVHWDLLIKAKVTTDLDAYNLKNGYTYYTGMPIKFNLSIPGTGGGSGYSTPFEIPLGPVIALHNYTPNSINPSHTDGSTLKPVADNKCISQTRGHEWYMGSDKTIHMTSNGNVNNDTEQGHTWNVTWPFNGTNLTATSSPDSGYNRQFAYPNNASPCIKIQHPASWTEIDGSVHSSDTGAWLISILNTTDPATGQELNGTLIGTVTVTDENSSLPNCKKVYEFYPSKNTTISISNYVSILESYWVRGVEHSGSTWTSDLVSCGTSATGLVLNPLVTTNGEHCNIEIYMNVQSGLTIDYICEDSDVDQYLSNYWWVEIVTGGNGDTTPDGQPYTHVAVIELGDPIIQVFLDHGPDHGVYSGKIFNTRLFAKQGETEVWSKTIPITIGRFGDAMHDNVPIVMSGAPGEFPNPRTYTFDAYGRFIQYLGDGVGPCIYPIDNSGTDVHGEVTFSDSALESIVSVSYNSDINRYTVSIPAWDPYAADQPQEWAGGSITSKITLQEPWYIADGPFTRVIRFERYLNFYREQSDSNYYVLADCPWGNYPFYCGSATITNMSNYRHQFSSSPLYVPALGKYVYYMTFRVTTKVSGDTTYAQIKRITKNEWGGNTTAIFWGQDGTYGTPLLPKIETDSNFSQSDIENADYVWFGQCTLVKNEYSSQSSNFYKHDTLLLSNGEKARPTYGWNLGQSGPVLWSSSLDEYPIWSNRWTEP